MREELKKINRWGVFFIFLFGLNNTIAQEYQLVTIENDSLVHSDSILITGKVYDAGYIIQNGALVSEVMDGSQTYSKEQGNFELMIGKQDSGIYVYKEGFKEVFVSNNKMNSYNRIEILFHLPYLENMIHPLEPAVPIEPDVSYKPVIYFYSEEIHVFTVDVEYKGEITFTYPELNDGWDITVDRNGIHSNDGNSYPYLFWEGEMQGLDYVSSEEDEIEGVWLSSNDVVAYLESSLDQLGLNSQEQTDFITFWAPRMVGYDQVFVQLVVDQGYDDLIGPTVTTDPIDSKRSVYLLFSGIDSEHQMTSEIVPQSFDSFERKGLTMVEWGGSELPVARLIKAL